MRHLLATEEDPPRAGGQLTTDEVKERRLPCAVGPENHAPLAWLDFQGQVAQSL